jgi:hypothetical protein
VAIALERLMDAWAKADALSSDYVTSNRYEKSWLANKIAYLCYERSKSLMRDAVASLEMKRVRHLTADLATETGEYVNLIRGWRRVYPDLLEV